MSTQPARQVTARQLQVLAYLAAGHSTHGTARELGLSVRSVQAHLDHLCKRIGACTPLHAVAIAHRQGWLPAHPELTFTFSVDVLRELAYDWSADVLREAHRLHHAGVKYPAVDAGELEYQRRRQAQRRAAGSSTCPKLVEAAA